MLFFYFLNSLKSLRLPICLHYNMLHYYYCYSLKVAFMAFIIYISYKDWQKQQVNYTHSIYQRLTFQFRKFLPLWILMISAFIHDSENYPQVYGSQSSLSVFLPLANSFIIMISTTSYVGRTLKSLILVLSFLLSSGSSFLTMWFDNFALMPLCWLEMKEISFFSPGMTISIKDLPIFPRNPSRNLCH